MPGDVGCDGGGLWLVRFVVRSVRVKAKNLPSAMLWN